MSNKNGLKLVFTGTDVIVAMLKSELELKGINSIVKDGFKDGIAAGFGGGIPSGIDLYVNEKDSEKAIEIVKALVE